MAEITAELTKELDKLKKALQSGRNDIVPFVGAAFSSPPLAGWRDVLEAIAAQAPAGAQEAARNAIGEGKLRDAAVALDTPGSRAVVEAVLTAHSQKPQEPRPA